MWIQQPDSLAIGVVKSKTLLGYGMVRKCRTGYKVGPLFADSEKIADRLFRRMCSFIGEGVSIFLDVPDQNTQAISLAERYAMKPMFETARMYTKDPPKTPLQKVFGVTTFEIG